MKPVENNTLKKIVGGSSTTLSGTILNQLNKLIEDVDNDQFSQSIDAEKLNNSLSELKKMQEILS